MENLPNMTKWQLDSLSRLLRQIYGDERDYSVLGTVEFYEKLKLYNDCSMHDMLDYVSLIYEYLRRSCSVMTSEYKRLHDDLLTVRQRQFTVQTLVARLSPSGLSDRVPWFPDVYKRVKQAHRDTKHEALKIVCLMIMGNVTEEEGGSIVPVPEETGILRIRDLVNIVILPTPGNSPSVCRLRIGKGLVSMGETFVRELRKLRELRELRELHGEPLSGDLIVDSDGNNDMHTYGWLCNVFSEEVGYTIAGVRLSYFNWRYMTGAGHMTLAKICAMEGYEAVITSSERLELGDKHAEFLSQCVVVSKYQSIGEYEMIDLYEAWYEEMYGEEERALSDDHIEDPSGEDERGDSYLNANRIEDLTGVSQDSKGNWRGLLRIGAGNSDKYANRHD